MAEVFDATSTADEVLRDVNLKGSSGWHEADAPITIIQIKYSILLQALKIGSPVTEQGGWNEILDSSTQASPV